MTIQNLLSHKELTTIEVLYHLPDYPDLLQSFLWQEYDLPPEFPRMLRFLEFWSQGIQAQLHSVRIVAAGQLVVPNAKMVEFYGTLN